MRKVAAGWRLARSVKTHAEGTEDIPRILCGSICRVLFRLLKIRLHAIKTLRIKPHVAVCVQGTIIGAYPNTNLTRARNNTFHVTYSWRAVAFVVLHHLLAVKPAALAGSHQAVGQRTSSHNRQYECY